MRTQRYFNAFPPIQQQFDGFLQKTHKQMNRSAMKIIILQQQFAGIAIPLPLFCLILFNRTEFVIRKYSANSHTMCNVYDMHCFKKFSHLHAPAQ